MPLIPHTIRNQRRFFIFSLICQIKGSPIFWAWSPGVQRGRKRAVCNNMPASVVVVVDISAPDSSSVFGCQVRDLAAGVGQPSEPAKRFQLRFPGSERARQKAPPGNGAGYIPATCSVVAEQDTRTHEIGCLRRSEIQCPRPLYGLNPPTSASSCLNIDRVRIRLRHRLISR